jgi:hypothetical protein
MAHQQIQSSATTGIFSTTTIQMNPHVIGAMVPGARR